MMMYDIVRTLADVHFETLMDEHQWIKAVYVGGDIIITFYDYVMSLDSPHIAFKINYSDIISIRKTDEGILLILLKNNQSLEVRL